MIPTRVPEAFLFDLDNTLYAYDPCHEFALRECSKLGEKILGLTVEEFHGQYAIARNEIHASLSNRASSHNRVLYFQRLVEKTCGRTEASKVLALYDTYWDAFFSKMVLADGALEFLACVKDLGIRSAIVTDLTSHIQLRKVDFLKIDKYIDFLITSEEVEYDKPDPAAVLLALKKLNVTAPSVWMVGDSLEKDIELSKQLGITPVYFTAYLRAVPDMDLEKLEPNCSVVRNFYELKELLMAVRSGRQDTRKKVQRTSRGKG